VRAGYQVVTIDGFADLDTLEVSVECVCLPLEDGRFVQAKLFACLSRVIKKYPHATILPGAGAEHLVDELARQGYTRLAACPEFIDQVTKPQVFFDCLDRLLIPHPEVSFEQPQTRANWLTKQLFSCGGVGVSTDQAATPGYWQQQVNGLPVSALCIADQREVRVIGISRQLTQSFSSSLPYVYSGAIANCRISKENKIKTERYVKSLRKEVNLLGVFSLDMIAAAEQLYVLEINPRVSASYELYERLIPGLNLVDAHIRVCEGERLPEFGLSTDVCAYRIIYANSPLIVPAGVSWPQWVKDKPEAGRSIERNEPVCSIYAAGPEDRILAQLKQYEEELNSIINNNINNLSKLK
jgi:methenyltetrahydromethanopterin cyclohydrolase